MEIKRKVSFQEYSEGIEKLAIMISDSGFMPSHIISIARGGLRVGDILSRLFRVRSSYLGVESYEIAEKGKVSDRQQNEVIFSRDISSTTQDFGNNILNAVGKLIKKKLPDARKICIIADNKLPKLLLKKLIKSLRKYDLKILKLTTSEKTKNIKINV